MSRRHTLIASFSKLGLLLAAAAGSLLLLPVDHALWAQTLHVQGDVQVRAPDPPPPQECKQFPGAVWTADERGRHPDNQFDHKEDVYLYSEPGCDGRIPDGRYYYRVTAPDGTPLSEPRAVEVKNGRLKVKLAPFNNSRSHEYKAWLSPSPDFPRHCSKTDNFRVGR